MNKRQKKKYRDRLCENYKINKDKWAAKILWDKKYYFTNKDYIPNIPLFKERITE